MIPANPVRHARAGIAVVLRALLLALLHGALLSGCARAPAPQLYLLDLPLAAELAGAQTGPVVGVEPLALPRYLDRPQIVTRDGANRLAASENHMWAEPVALGAARVVNNSLATALGSNRVYRLPARHPIALDWRVEIDIDRFDGSLDAAVTLEARWSLFEGGARTPAVTRLSHIDITLDNPRHAALVAAQTRALERLGTEIAAAIDAARQGTSEQAMTRHLAPTLSDVGVTNLRHSPP